jgi:hypothetical protein
VKSVHVHRRALSKRHDRTLARQQQQKKKPLKSSVFDNTGLTVEIPAASVPETIGNERSTLSAQAVWRHFDVHVQKGVAYVVHDMLTLHSRLLLHTAPIATQIHCSTVRRDRANVLLSRVRAGNICIGAVLQLPAGPGKRTNAVAHLKRQTRIRRVGRPFAHKNTGRLFYVMNANVRQQQCGLPDNIGTRAFRDSCVSRQNIPLIIYAH